jgi:hypothetical protein
MPPMMAPVSDEPPVRVVAPLAGAAVIVSPGTRVVASTTVVVKTLPSDVVLVDHVKKTPRKRKKAYRRGTDKTVIAGGPV